MAFSKPTSVRLSHSVFVFPIGKQSIVMSVSVCLCVAVFVCPRSNFCNTRPIFTKFSMRVSYDRGSVLLWRRSDTLCTSGFTDDVIFAHKPRLLDAHAALSLAINCVQ